MTSRIIKERIIINEAGEEIFEIETKGDLKFMPRKCSLATAIFGTFERTEEGTLLYTATIERENDGTLAHNPDSEYADDLRALKSGNIEIFD